jgi:hypothetical protein
MSAPRRRQDVRPAAPRTLDERYRRLSSAFGKRRAVDADSAMVARIATEMV